MSRRFLFKDAREAGIIDVNKGEDSNMEKDNEDRRRASYSGLLDSAIRSITKLTTVGDTASRGMAHQALADLMRLRRALPARRETDGKTHKG